MSGIGRLAQRVTRTAGGGPHEDREATRVAALAGRLNADLWYLRMVH